MKYQRMTVLLALCAALVACDMPAFNYSGKNGKITLNGNLLTLHADHAPDATIGSSGNFTIDGKAVPLSPPQRGLLMLYYQGVMDIRVQVVGMGKAGAMAGVKALQNSIGEKSNPDEKKKAGDDVSPEMHQLSLKMCQDESNLKTVQDQLAAQISAFKPYGDIFTARSVDECMKDN
jgi:hypothetical protein